MEQPGLFDLVSHWTVTDLTRRVRQLLENAQDLQDIWVQGEISNLSRPSSGHVYFTLKDSGAALRCVMWRGDAARQKISPADGTSVEVHGSIGVYEAGGQYQLYADIIQPLGEGALFAEFMRLKALLEAEGLFDPSRKRPIPSLPGRIGIITSPSGAALQDILNTLRRRYPLAEVVLAPAPVQGVEAPAALITALDGLNRIVEPDVILLARGGGSIEDLWAFNDERLVRAICQSRAPVITGVGHETDFTLADFAADLRAPTPTAAAEMATPITIDDLRENLDAIGQTLKLRQTDRLRSQRASLEDLQSRIAFLSPLRRVQDERQRLDDLFRRVATAQVHRLHMSRTRLQGIGEQLQALNPQAVLGRGYAVVFKLGKVVRHRAQVEDGDGIQVRVQDGEFDARVSGEQV